MKICKLLSALLATIVVACLGVQGQFQEQYMTPSGGYSTVSTSVSQNPSQYTQFYSMVPGPAPNNPIGAPQPFDAAGIEPHAVYIGGQMQQLSYSQYQSDPGLAEANGMWIKGATDWTQYAAVPQGATVSILAISPAGGSGSLVFVDSNGQTYSHDYVFYPKSIMTFYAGTIGRHILSFAVNGRSSNQVVIDVMATNTQPVNYPEYGSGYSPGYPWNYYPGYYVSPISPDEINKGRNTYGDHWGWNPRWDDNGGDNPGLDNRSPGWHHRDWNPGGSDGGEVPGLDNRSPGWGH